MLKLENLSIKVQDKILIDNLNLDINTNEVHFIMGKNGIGKSSIAKTIMGDPNYNCSGKIIFNGEDITNFSIDKRANLGIYLVNQSPMAIEGVTNAEMLRLAYANKTKENVNIFSFNKKLADICEMLELDKKFIHKEINVNCSGGERKKIELMHMWVIEPQLIILDEIDSGLDVDAQKLVENNLHQYLETHDASLLIITHSKNLLESFPNSQVHVIDNQKLIKSGDVSLGLSIINEGFKNISGNLL